MKADRPAATAFHAITHVWGREYLDLFLRLCVPNQLAPGNVPALPAGSRYRILTASEHVEELETHEMIQALRAVIPVDVVVVEAIDRQKGQPLGQDLMIACHQRALDDAEQANAAIIMLSADFIFSHRALAAVVQRHREGYRAVLNTGLRLAKEPFLESLDDSRPDLRALSSRELVRMGLPHLHPEIRSMFIDAPRFMAAPFAVYWPVGNEGLVARCFQLHPLMVDPMVRKTLKGTNDGHFVSRVCPDHAKVHIVTDSDELQMFELTTLARKAGTSDGGVSLLRCAMMADERDALQLSYWTQRNICLHTGELDRQIGRAHV